MAKLKRSGDYWRVGDLDGRTGVFASEPFLQKNPKGDEIYYIQVKLDDSTKLWGMSWSAYNALFDILGDEGLRWINARVKFQKKPMKTQRGEVLTLMANPISGQGGKAVNEVAAGSQADSSVPPTQESQVSTTPKTDETPKEFSCPNGCGFRTDNLKVLGNHLISCEADSQLPSNRRSAT